MREDLNIPHKTGRIFNLILLAFILIFLRIWYLNFVQGDYHRKQAIKPQRRTSVEKVERATVRDRFNIPLAQNKIDYIAAVRYADIREIPAYKWQKDSTGKRVKTPVRGPYITALASLLSKELSMDEQEVEDIIYAKASLFPHTPFALKKSLSESQYYKLRMLQKDWVGIEMQRSSKRVYPLEKTGCDVVGYMGAISYSEYLQIAEEIGTLEEYIGKREAGELVLLPEGFESPMQVRKRLEILKEKAYTINDSVGKAGIEYVCDEQLRGTQGKKISEIDPRGSVIRELPGSKKGVSGQRVFLSISSELQEFTEAILAHHESLRDLKDSSGNILTDTPWIKGAGAVLMNPTTGEILALASYPRFDPNDFVKSHDTFEKEERLESVRRWMENEDHIEDLWKGKVDFEKEIYLFDKGWQEQRTGFNWDRFINTIVGDSSGVKEALNKIKTIGNAHLLLTHFEKILRALDVQDAAAVMQSLYPEKPHVGFSRPLSKDILRFTENKLQICFEEIQDDCAVLRSFLSEIRHNEDKLLALDLIRLLIVPSGRSPDTFPGGLGSLSLQEFFSLSQSFNSTHDSVKSKVRELYRKIDFRIWRKEHFASFLKEKRKEEKRKKAYARPYTEYLEKIEPTLFSAFWETNKYIFLLQALNEKTDSLPDIENLSPYFEELAKFSLSPGRTKKIKEIIRHLSYVDTLDLLRGIRSFKEFNSPLYGKYRMIRHAKGVQLEKHLASSFYPLSGFGYGRSQAFRQATPQGSVFKLVVAYEALKERYEHLKEHSLISNNMNPFSLIDNLRLDMKPNGKQILGYKMDGEPIRRMYNGGLMPKSSHTGIGKVDLPSALEQSSNIYFSILAAEHIADPVFLEKAAKDLGFGTKTGIELRGEIPGTIPNDLSYNKSGLYAFAIGQHSLIVTPLQTAVMLGGLGNHGEIVKPQIIALKAGKSRSEDPLNSYDDTSYPFREALSLAGIDFPLFTETLPSSYNACIEKVKPEILRTLFLPREVKAPIFEGMDRTISGIRGTANPHIIRYLRNKPELLKQYSDLKGELIGKTGTAEIFYKQTLDAGSKGQIRNHIWFGGLLFPKGSNILEDKAELAIVVYLRFSISGGKEAAALAVQIASKWREIQKKHGASSYLEKEAKDPSFPGL